MTEPTVTDHIQSCLEKGMTPEQTAHHLCERLNNYTPFQKFLKEARNLANFLRAPISLRVIRHKTLNKYYDKAKETEKTQSAADKAFDTANNTKDQKEKNKHFNTWDNLNKKTAGQFERRSDLLDRAFKRTGLSDNTSLEKHNRGFGPGYMRGRGNPIEKQKIRKKYGLND